MPFTLPYTPLPVLDTNTAYLPGESFTTRMLRVHGIGSKARESASEPESLSLASHSEFPRLVSVYGHLTIPEMDARLESMHVEAQHLLRQHTREFDGNGGRRYGAAMSTQAGREMGQERLLLLAFRDYVIKSRERE